MSSPRVARVNGPVVEVANAETLAMLELVHVGAERLPGEVIARRGGGATVQVYEYTGGLRPGARVDGTGAPLVAALGPGLLGGVFDGMLRGLDRAGDWLEPGVRHPRGRPWQFEPAAIPGQVRAGQLLGTVRETAAIEFRVLVPPDLSGELEWLATGDLRPEDPVARIDGHEVPLAQRWPVRRPRPVAQRLRPGPPLRTGQRALDLFFPIALGSTAAIPGGFGTGKTVLLQQIAKHCDADVIVYVGCGERGNEMADVLEELPQLEDPRSGRPLMERTVLIANTSNMPVLAREASIHTGVTVAELYRDMGYDVVLIADSTSRWAEALREVASRTGELPAEEGYPAGLASSIAGFYERAARARTLAGGEGSVTILGAVSPAGGDMTEPVTAHTRRFTRCTWSLDRDLAYARHYPAVSWRESGSRDAETVAAWSYLQGDVHWGERRERALALLADGDRIESIAQLVGVGSLPDADRLTLFGARLVRDAVLQQSALSENDGRCDPSKQSALLELVLAVHDRCLELARGGVAVAALEDFDFSAVTRARDTTPPDGAAAVAHLQTRVLADLGRLA